LLSLFAFVVGGVVAQRLFHWASRPWRQHFDTADATSLGRRLQLLGERLLFGLLILGAFAAGSMGIFTLLRWPAETGWIILGYLVASLLIRLSLTGTRFFLAPSVERMRLVPMDTETAFFWHVWLAVLTTIATESWQTILMLRSLGLPPAETDLLVQALLLVLALVAVAMVWRRPQQEAGSPLPHRRARLLTSLFIGLVWLLLLMGATETALSLLILAVVPVALHVLRSAASRVVRGHWPVPGEDIAPIAAIADRCMMALVLATAAYALSRSWQIDPFSMSDPETTLARIGRGGFEALVILLAADLLWLVVRAVIDRRLQAESGAEGPDDENLRVRRTRVRTLLPVLRNFAFFFVLIMASLSALGAMGLQIGPLLAGAGVVGIAMGFGAQTLVRDILSGVFFLLDDAFRVGEMIESATISGTVESFSLRSLRLRHFKGHLHTVPFGELKVITNFSRDWVNEQLQVMVPYDTDLDAVELAIEKVSADVMATTAVAGGILEPLVSLGVTAMTDAGIQIGLIVKTRPGEQFATRRAVFSRLKTRFAEGGVRFASNAATPL